MCLFHPSRMTKMGWTCSSQESYLFTKEDYGKDTTWNQKMRPKFHWRDGVAHNARIVLGTGWLLQRIGTTDRG